MYRYEFTNVLIDPINTWIKVPLKLPTRQTVTITNQGVNNDLATEVVVEVNMHDDDGFTPNNAEHGAALGLRDVYMDDVGSNIAIWVKSGILNASVTVIERDKNDN